LGPKEGTTVSSGSEEPRWLSDSEQDHWRAYLRGSRYLEEALDRDLQTHGLQLTEYEILSMLSESEGGRLRMSELADLVVQSRSRLTHTAARLEKRGWVERQSCLSDRRGVELVLTDDGWERLNTMAKAHVESVRRHLLDVMAPGEFAALGVAMGKVRDAALGIHQAVVAEACAEAELEEDLDGRRDWSPDEAVELAGIQRDA
jgi:DNA-binding MarR family transcriptional regulator